MTKQENLLFIYLYMFITTENYELLEIINSISKKYMIIWENADVY